MDQRCFNAESSSIHIGRLDISIVISFLLVIIFFTGCKNRKQEEKTFTETEVNSPKITIHRYEQAVFGLDQKSLEKELSCLTGEYSFFLGQHPGDEANLVQLKAYLNDSLIKELFAETVKAFPSLDSMEQELGGAFARYQKLLPGSTIPAVYTYISGLDYESPIRLADSVLLIALDMYLGEGRNFYDEVGIPAYRQFASKSVFLVPDCMKQLIIHQIPDQNRNETLLDWMLLYGKILYFLDQVLPERPDYQKITYSPEQLKWCLENEKKVWGMLIHNNLLFTKDSKEIVRFIADAPFTKGMPEASPGRTGWFMGWQIIRQFMEKNDRMTLRQLLQMTDSQKILSKSGYKPGK